jgi:hypothetical protein
MMNFLAKEKRILVPGGRELPSYCLQASGQPEQGAGVHVPTFACVGLTCLSIMKRRVVYDSVGYESPDAI